MLRVSIDSAGDLPAEWIDEYDVQIIPINIHFGEQMFLQGVDLSNADFYRICDESGVIPKTSQPTPQQFVDFYRRIAQLGDTILSIHVTSKLSGTLASAEIAARELKDEFEVIPLDSGSGSAAMGYMCQEARLLERSGASVKQIVERIKSVASNMVIVLTLDTLEYARRSGRVKALQAALASLLNVKPIIILREGALELGDRVRTRRKSLEYILDLVAQRVGDRLVNAAVVHAEDLKSGQQLMQAVRSRLNCKQLIMTELSIGIAANLGPGTVGIVAYPVEEG
ncbi:MAG: DegV family protein [Anaerolineales bacterium]|nr:DegV family protein [Anaerolineales bacterium]